MPQHLTLVGSEKLCYAARGNTALSAKLKLQAAAPGCCSADVAAPPISSLRRRPLVPSQNCHRATGIAGYARPARLHNCSNEQEFDTNPNNTSHNKNTAEETPDARTRRKNRSFHRRRQSLRNRQVA